MSAHEDMARVAAMVKERGAVRADERERLAAKALRLIEGHYGALLDRTEIPPRAGIRGVEQTRLAHGENPYQEPASLFAACPGNDDPLALHRFERISGETPCFTNMADLDSVVATLCRLAGAYRRLGGGLPHIAVAAKHGNACGLSADRTDPLEAIEGALWGDPAAVWGGGRRHLRTGRPRAETPPAERAERNSTGAPAGCSTSSPPRRSRAMRSRFSGRGRGGSCF